MIKKRVLLKFNPEIVSQPITYYLIKRYNIVINILQARIFPEEEGQLILEMQNEEEEHIHEGIGYLEDQGVRVRILEESLRLDRDSCIDCGACTGVCKVGALEMNPNTHELEIDSDRCLLCEMCIPACPVAALSLER